MGGRFPSTATPHVNWRYKREIFATFPVGEEAEGEGTAVLTPAATKTCKAAVEAWR